MRSDWKQGKLGDFIELKRGYDLPKRLRKIGDVPLISSAGISDCHNESKATGPGVITGRYGTIGKVFFTHDNFWPLNTTLYVRDFKGNDEMFVYYFLKTINYNEYSDKAAVPGVNRNHLHMAHVTLPPLPEQKRIAHILGSLDDKIALNRKMNATLEAMAQALFKSWFVDFDPVIDNALRAGNPIPEPLQQRAETRRKALADPATPNSQFPTPHSSLFPATFTHSEDLGWIPEGWEATTLGEHINFSTGPAFKSKEFTTSGTRLARGDNVKEGRFQWGHKSRYWPTVDTSLEKHLLCEGDVLLGMDGSKVGKNRVRVRAADLPCLLVQRVARLCKKKTICNSFIFLVVNGEYFRDYVEVVKTGSAIPHISGGQIKNYPLVLPQHEDCPVFAAFETQASALFNRTDSLVADSMTLTKLRDTLLPKLISGEQSSSHTEQAIQ